MKKKFVIPILISVLMSSSVSALAANFSDINDVPWEGAKTYINDVADKQIMVGSVEGGKTLFKARNNLSYAEAAQICYTLLKSTGKVDSGDYKKKWEAVMAGYNIPVWAYESVSYCLEKSIVTISDLSLFMTGSSSNFATRENVSKFIGKALSGLGYESQTSVLLSDISKVSAEALPYVKLIAGLEIIVGDDNKNFNPGNRITRAEMAVVCSKTYTVLKGNSSVVNPAAGVTAYGTVVSNESVGTSCVLTIKTSTGQTLSFLTTSSVPMTFNNKDIKNTYLEENDVVSFVYTGAALNSLTLITDVSGGGGGSEYSTFISGTIETINSTKVKLENHSGYYNFSSDLEDITLDDKDSTISKIISACDNYTVTAKLLMDEDNYVIGIYAAKDESEVYGEIESVSSSKIKVDGESYYYADEDDLIVKIDGSTKNLDKLIDKFEEFEEDDEVLYATLELDSDGDVERILALTEAKKDESGEVKSITETKIKVGSETHYLADEDDLTIKVDGSTKSLSSFIDICKDDDEVTVKLTFDDDDYVIKIVATTSESDETKDGTIKSVSKSSLKLGTKTYYYEDEDDLTVRINDEKSSLSDLMDAVDEGTVTATIYLNSDNEITKIYAETDEDDEDFDVNGELKSISSSSLKIDSKSYDIDDTDDIDISINDGDDEITTYKALKDAIEDGKIIDADVEIRDGYVYEISGDVEGIEGAEIYEVYPSDDEIKLKLSSGKYTYTVKGSADITLDGKDSTLTKIKNKIADETVVADIEFRSGVITVIDAEVD